MTFVGFIAKNAFRNLRRAALTVLSMAVSLFLLVTLMTLVREFTIPPEDVGASLRVVVRNKVSLAQPLPYKQLTIIDKIPGVVAATPFTYFGGLFRDETSTMFAQFGVDPVRFTNIFIESKAPVEQVQDWVKDRQSCLVGKGTMDKYHLKLGERMRFTGTFYPCDLDLRIAGVYSGGIDDRNVFFHQKYLDEASGNPGTVGTWWLRIASAEVSPQVTRAIDQAFANTSAEVRAESERAFQMSFVSMWGNIKTLVGSIASVVVFSLMLVTVSTMSMAIRERFRELAILKALGFRRHEIFSFILAESFGLALIGAVLGVGGAWLFWSSINIQKVTAGTLIAFEVTPRLAAEGMLVAVVLGIVAAIPPSIAVGRTSVVAGLRTLD
ncbi:MAG TPA: FtsX-like permease family protein [Candidatus Limnocylindria bacterium]|nr:FtsX-like permease family protein [Candidatus Limnocylindria bacterium]